jgi:hypothetical protein
MKKPPKHVVSAAEFRKAIRKLHDAELWQIPITAGEARKLHRTFADHLCSRPPARCQVCKARDWFTKAWDRRKRSPWFLPE